jgi:putative lipase involved disintegration of autophagic bodies
MDLIIDEELFEVDKIELKNGTTGQKILYKMDHVYLLGIPLKIHGFKIIKQTNKYIIITMDDTKQYRLLKSIDRKFVDEYRMPYKSFINNDVLRIKKNKETHYTEQSDLYISINNIKMKNSFITVQLFTI